MSVQTVTITLPDGNTILALTRFFARVALKRLGYHRKLHNEVWESAAVHGATVNWGGLHLKRRLHPQYTKSFDDYGLVDPQLVERTTTDGGYTVGDAHPNPERGVHPVNRKSNLEVAKSSAEVFRALIDEQF